MSLSTSARMVAKRSLLVGVVLALGLTAFGTTSARPVGIEFQLHDPADGSTHIDIDIRGTGGALDIERTPGDGLGAVYRLDDRVVDNICRRNPRLCRLLTGTHNIGVRFTLYDDERQHDIVVEGPPAGQILRIRGGPTPGDGFGPIYKVVDVLVEAACDASARVCRLLTRENEL